MICSNINGNFMVSIHIVPVDVFLIISVIYFIFLFKRGIICYSSPLNLHAVGFYRLRLGR